MMPGRSLLGHSFYWTFVASYLGVSLDFTIADTAKIILFMMPGRSLQRHSFIGRFDFLWT
jgi:hypothetical protein